MLYEISWSRKYKKFRWLDENENEYLCTEAEGYCWIVDTDNERGRIYVLGKLELENEFAFVSCNSNIEDVIIPEGSVEVGTGNYARMCWRKNQTDWRLRDENGNGQVKFVNTYRGLWLLDWHDHQAHLFHKGRTFISPDNTAHLVPLKNPSNCWA